MNAQNQEEYMAELEAKLAAANKRIEDSQKLEAVGWMWMEHGWIVTAHSKHRGIKKRIDVSRPADCTVKSDDFISLHKLYASPVIPPDVAELQARIEYIKAVDAGTINELRAQIARLEVACALYSADAERCWSHMPEFENHPAEFELHEAVHEIKAQLERYKVVMKDMAEVLWYVIDYGVPCGSTQPRITKALARYNTLKGETI